MSHPQKPPATNGIGRRRIDKDGFNSSDNLSWRQPGRMTSNSSFQGWNKGIHGRLIYMQTCLIGQHVEVEKIDGHVYSGIFHAAVMDNEYGVILKMARLVREGPHSVQGDSVRQAARNPPIRTYVISGKDFVQIVAKDVSLSGDSLANIRVRENHTELVTDSVVSQGWHRESERELKPWKPDDEFYDPTSTSLSNTWRSRNWDQFEANKSLFGVETTFDEELYTTKLVRGPELREREREAQRIALEIVGQQTRNVHVAEERGVQLAPELESMDEESKYSSVLRGCEELGGDDDDDQNMNDHNDETFGESVTMNFGSTLKSGDELSLSNSEPQVASGSAMPEVSRDRQDFSLGKVDGGSTESSFESHKEHFRLPKLLVGDKVKYCNKGSGSPYNSPIGTSSPAGDPAGIKALNLDSSCPQVPDEVFREFNEFKQQKALEARKSASESFKSIVDDVDYQKELEPRSPSISASASPMFASKKSLNPNAKEFRLNPNAQAFTPSSCSSRSPLAVPQLPLAAQSPMYLHPISHGGTIMQGSPVNLQSIAQQNPLSPYIPGVAGQTTAYMASRGGSVPGFPVGGIGGGGILPGQPSLRAPTHAQHQYPQHMMYGQPAGPGVFLPYSQGHLIPSPGHGRLIPSQPQQNQPQQNQSR